jgi:aspartate-semialdehyde dehydrogenase
MGLSYNEFQFKFSSSSYSLYYTDMIPALKNCQFSEMVVTVRNVPLTTYMEDIVLSTVSKNSGKGRIAMEYVVDKLKNETRPISDYLDKLKLEVIDLKHLVSENVIKTAQVSIEELQKKIKTNIIEPEFKSITAIVNSEPVLNVRAEIEASSSIL